MAVRRVREIASRVARRTRSGTLGTSFQEGTACGHSKGSGSSTALAAFKFAHGGPSIERPPARVGEHTDEVLTAVGYSAEQLAALRKSGAIA
jgi:crotonobetainyl-CoA:carnitine CoA-transferase CaiB-like acyl-CoA transferase